MAALSYYYSEPTTMADSHDYDQLQAFPDQPFFDPDDLFHPSLNLDPSSLPIDFSSNNNPVFHPYNYPKIEKMSGYDQTYSPDQFMINEPDFLDGLFQNPNCAPYLEDYYLQPRALFVSPAFPNYPTGPPVYSSGSCEGLKLETAGAAGGFGGPSAQSIAARQRRRKITEKTQELGKLVPGGQKMNTAEMLQAAYKYIQFLQAQVGILEFVSSHDHQENGESLENSEAMQILLGSCLIQEKLYSSEKCLVPENLVKQEH